MNIANALVTYLPDHGVPGSRCCCLYPYLVFIICYFSPSVTYLLPCYLFTILFSGSISQTTLLLFLFALWKFVYVRVFLCIGQTLPRLVRLSRCEYAVRCCYVLY